MFLFIYLFFCWCLSRATPVKAEATVAEEEELVMMTMRSPPSHPLTMLTLLCYTSWTMSQVTPSIPCLTTACSTPTLTRSCPPSWCPTCWVRTPTSSLGLCTQWVQLFSSILFFLVLCACASQALWWAISLCGRKSAQQFLWMFHMLVSCRVQSPHRAPKIVLNSAEAKSAYKQHWKNKMTDYFVCHS